MNKINQKIDICSKNDIKSMLSFVTIPINSFRFDDVARDKVITYLLILRSWGHWNIMIISLKYNKHEVHYHADVRKHNKNW